MEKTKKQGFFMSIKNSIFNFDSYQDFVNMKTAPENKSSSG